MNSTDKKINLKIFKINNLEELNKAEKQFRKDIDQDFMPWAIGTRYKEIAETIIQDKNGAWKTPLNLIVSHHSTTIGIGNLCVKAVEFIQSLSEQNPIDILSLSSGMENNKLVIKILVRAYSGTINFVPFFNFIGDSLFEEEQEEELTGNLIIPEEVRQFEYSKEEKDAHVKAAKKQKQVLENCTKDKPFLNAIDEYIPTKLPQLEDKTDLLYDLKTNDMKMKIMSNYEDFTAIFREVMTVVSGIEYYNYIAVMKGDAEEEAFMNFLKAFITERYIDTKKMPIEDLGTMLDKLYRSLFQFYIIQDLIDDPNVSDIKITAHDSIRARVKGKAYITNITFIDPADYIRFVNGIAIKNKISQNIPSQTFTDTSDPNYILRFSITAEYVNSVAWPYLHIRKIDRNKPLADDLINAGMMDKKLRDYLLDCGKNSRGVVFAGPPGSGKTVCLNWFLEEAYEQSAEILVIQENDELFAYRKGVMFQHVVNYANGIERPVNLEELGQLALVAGANVFIIGETKGAEICSAITLSNSGCRTAITVHSPSSTETINKMADLAMRGYAKDINQAKEMLRSFQTIVYLENFKIKEITEITGYNEDKHDMDYRYIYRREVS